MPSGIRFQELQKEDYFVYLIEVDKSMFSPHQFNKEIYPMRMGANAVAAPDHYIEALFKKVSFPNLACKLVEANNGEYIPHMKLYRYEYEIEISNQSHFLNEENLYFSVTVSGGKLDPGNIVESPWSQIKPATLIFPNIQPILFYGAPYIGRFNLTLGSDLDGKQILINILIGGKNSPLKEFAYSL